LYICRLRNRKSLRILNRFLELNNVRRCNSSFFRVYLLIQFFKNLKALNLTFFGIQAVFKPQQSAYVHPQIVLQLIKHLKAIINYRYKYDMFKVYEYFSQVQN